MALTRILVALVLSIPSGAILKMEGSLAAESAAAVGGESDGGYLLVASDGAVYDFGAGSHGSMAGKPLAHPIVGLAATPTGDGYWMVASDGGIFSFGDAEFHGSTGNLVLNKPIGGMAATPTGAGYWFVASDGGIFSFGDATFFGSTGDTVLNKPIVGMAATPTGAGYWMVASDGGIFSFGDATFFGSTGDTVLNKPIVGMAATPTGAGYWMVASDGGIFSFGDATFFGSTGDTVLNKPIEDMAATKTGKGYWMVASDGGIFNFGDADFKGSAGNQRINGRVVDMLLQGGDVVAPVLRELSFSPASVDTSGGAKTIRVRARITDDLAGNADENYRSSQSQIRFVSPSGAQSTTAMLCCHGERTSGTPQDGIYESDLAVAAFAEQGTWTIQNLLLVDQAGNSTTIDGSTLRSAGYQSTFSQLGAGDVTPPVLRELSFSPASVDTSGGAKTIRVRARITDDLAGNADENYRSSQSQIRFVSPSGAQSTTAMLCCHGERTSGTPQDGIYESDLAVAAFAEQGTWTIQNLLLVDQAGNSTNLDEARLRSAGHPTSFAQTGPGDTTPPSVVELSWSPTSVDTSGGAKTIRVRARITDDLAGNADENYRSSQSQIRFVSPSGAQSTTAMLCCHGERTSGTPQDGIYESDLAVAAFAEQGTWTIQNLLLVDQAGNSTTIDTATLQGRGYPTTFEVQRTGG